MKKKSNIEFESLLENDEFIRLVNADPFQAEKQIERVCLENPGKEDVIRDAVELLQHYRLKQNVDRKVVHEMWKAVLERSRSGHRRRTGLVWQVAASVGILIALSFYGYYSFRDNPLKKLANKQVEAFDEARIMISDGREIALKSNGSAIRYEADGKEITIEGKDNKKEKLNNHTENTKPVFNQIVVPYGRRHSLTLSDGTIVQLNSGSRLVFPARFSEGSREVYLKGEGYFAVTKKDGAPFFVKTDVFNVRVLGTRFNVTAYEDDLIRSAVLVEGSVEVFTNDFFKKKSCKIVPGQGCFFSDQSSDFQVRDVDLNEYVAWTKGTLQFRDQSFAAVIERVRRYYNVAVVVEDDELAGRLISGKLVLSDNTEETLTFLAKTTKSSCFLKGGSYFFSKR